MTYLVDSDYIIDALAGIPSAHASLRRHANDGLAVSVITYGEIYEGAFGLTDPALHLAQFRRFLQGFVLYGLGDDVMEIFARQRSALRRQGNLIPDFDLLIAATALRHGLVLMTRNLRHFSRISNLKFY